LKVNGIISTGTSLTLFTSPFETAEGSTEVGEVFVSTEKPNNKSLGGDDGSICEIGTDNGVTVNDPSI
jgi:hypothetical protein